MVITAPVALPANWIYRTTAVHSPAAYFGAARKSLYLLIGLPLWMTFALFYIAIWPVKPVVQHLATLAAAAVLIIELSVHGLRKIPFTCSYLPGKANLKVTLPLYGSLVLFCAYQSAELEFWAMQRPARYAIVLGILLAAALWARRWRAAFANAAHTPLQFEDLPPGSFQSLGISYDGDLPAAGRYVDSAAPVTSSSR
jgi:hypothetical protein